MCCKLTLNMVVFADLIVEDVEEPRTSKVTDTTELENLSIDIPLEETEIKKKKISNTRELLKRVKDSANQKLAHSINLNEINENKKYSKQAKDSSPFVLRGSESPAWHGLLTKTLLKRQPTKQAQATTTLSVTTSISNKQKNCSNFGYEKEKEFSKCNICQCKETKSCGSCFAKSKTFQSCLCHDRNVNENSKTQIGTQRSIFSYFNEVRREYKDFREIEAVRLQRRLEKLADIPESSIYDFEGKKINNYKDELSNL